MKSLSLSTGIWECCDCRLENIALQRSEFTARAAIRPTFTHGEDSVCENYVVYSGNSGAWCYRILNSVLFFVCLSL